MPKPKFDSSFDEKLVAIFLQFQVEVEKLIPSIQSGAVTIEEAIIPLLNELKFKFDWWAEYRITEEFLRGAELEINGNDIEWLLNDLEWTTIATAQPQLDDLVANTLSIWNIEALGQIIGETIDFNEVAMSKFLDNLETAFLQDETERIAEILSLANDLTSNEKKQALITLVEDKWLVYFTDSWWRKRTPERYTEMLVRTETAKAYNQWTISAWIEAGVTKFIRDEAIDCCPDICEVERGRIVDITQEELPYLILHNNCRWTWIPIVE